MKGSQKLIKVATAFHKDANINLLLKIWSHLFKKKYKVNISSHVIRESMKDELELIFKKSKSKPLRLNFTKQSYIKSFFSVRLIKKMNNFFILLILTRLCSQEQQTAPIPGYQKEKNELLIIYPIRILDLW